MNPMVLILIILVVLIIWFITLYNRLVRNKNMAEEGWSGIDVQLKRRVDLIPNLVESVKGYMGHEQKLLKEITDLRTRTMNTSAIGEKSQTENALSRSLSQLFAVAEAYPDLNANKNFIHLQTQLAEIENQIQMARRYYNGTVRNLNILIDSFPATLVASTFHFEKREFFEVEKPEDRELPPVKF
jgi:LemA protein